MSNEAQKQTDIPSEYLLDLTAGSDNPDKGTQTAPQTQDAGQQQTQQTGEPELPEKYRGKTAAEIAEMHRNLESELGRARNEIGQVRRLADELLGINRAQTARTEAANQPPARKPLTPDDILSNPEQAITAVVKAEADTRVRTEADRIDRLEAELVLARFERKHPDYRTTMEDPQFVSWVQRSTLRGQLAQAAAAGNYAAADELFTLYEEAKAMTATTQQTTQTDAARKAGLARPGGASAAGGAGQDKGGKPIWSRAKLMEMRINNPEEFERLQPEILLAYAEKRVK